MRRLLTLFATFVMFASGLTAGETYIIPVFGIDVEGADGRYFSSIGIVNTSASPAKVNVVAAYPVLRETRCSFCPTLPQPLEEVRPHSKFLIGYPGRRIQAGDLKLGALVIESDIPVEVESLAFRESGGRSQVVEVTRDWIEAGRRSTAWDALGISPANLFLINPNDQPIRVDYWTGFNAVTTTEVPPHSTKLVLLPENFACPRGCGGGTSPAGSGYSLHVRADGRYLAAVSMRSTFVPIVRVTRVSE